MASLRELLGAAYKEGMTLAEAETVLSEQNLVNLSTGDYVSKAKWKDDLKLLETYKEQAEGKQAEIDRAVAKAREEEQAAAKIEFEKQLKLERTADKRKRAKENHYKDLTEEQKGIYDAFIKDEDLKLSDDKEEFSNFDELAKPLREKYKSVFPVDDGSHGAAGVPHNGKDSANAGTAEIFGFNFTNAPAKK